MLPSSPNWDFTSEKKEEEQVVSLQLGAITIGGKRVTKGEFCISILILPRPRSK